MDTAKTDEAKAVAREAIKTVNNAYLDKLSLISKDKITPGTKSALKAVEKITKKTGVNISNTVKDWTKGFNLSKKPDMLNTLSKTKIK